MTEIVQATNPTAIMGFAQVTNNIENIPKESSELFMLAKKNQSDVDYIVV